MNNDIAIKVDGVSKKFKIPHEKITSLRGAAVSAFKKNTYEEFNALDDVSFEVEKGEFFGIIGRNGSGKSTLLKILAGIYKPDKGRVEINGRISPFLELGIGFNPELSGRDNVYLNATVLGLTKKEIDEKFDSIVKFSELERFIDQKLKNYSSGMQVRLAFSVSIHANREILLMDEVLAVGDSNFQSKCLTEFNRYKEMGKTVILVTHDIGTVQRYCDRALLLRNGKILKIGEANLVGDEYVYQNIRDEEDRYSNELQKQGSVDEDKAHKSVRISNVKFLNAENKEKNVFVTRDFLKVRVYFDCHEDVEDLLIGVAIFDENRNVIYGTNNQKIMDESILIQKNQQGYIDFIFNAITLLNGRYEVNIALAKENGRILDQHIDRYYFIINQGLLQDYGVVFLCPEVVIKLKK